MLGVIDYKDGAIYKFENPPHPDVQLHAIRNDRIIGSFLMSPHKVVQVASWRFDGQCMSGNRVNLTPYDKFKDLKKTK